MRSANRTGARPGAIAPMAALKMVFLIILVAFAVDLSWIVLTNMELQNAADAAALAGSDKLMENYVLFHMPNQSEEQKAYLLSQAMNDARRVAKEFAAKNSAGGVSSLVLLDQDIEFGFMNEQYEYTPMPPYEGYPNTMRVRIRRDNLANTPLELFFARAPRGTNSRTLFATLTPLTRVRIDLNRSAAASLNGGLVNSFNPGAGSLAVLPMALDEAIWDAYLTTGVDPYGNQTRVDELGNPTLEIYSLYKNQGNFGELSLDGLHCGTNDIITWIDNGLQAADVESLLSSNLLPVSPDNMTWNWIGNPGFKSSTVKEVNDYVSTVVEVNDYASTLETSTDSSGQQKQRYIGKVFLLPLFKAKDGSPANYQAGEGQGSNYYYNIVRFVGVRIMPTQDPNHDIVVQPAPFIDPREYFQQMPKPVVPPSEDSPVITTFAPPTLTR
jgi:hypothetical protein